MWAVAWSSANLIISEGSPVVKHGVVVEQLDVARFQRPVHPQVITTGQCIKVLQSLLLLLCQPGNLWMPLCKLIIGSAVVHAQVTLHSLLPSVQVSAMYPKQNSEHERNSRAARRVRPQSCGSEHNFNKLFLNQMQAGPNYGCMVWSCSMHTAAT